jgi:hypothetical protein
MFVHVSLVYLVKFIFARPGFTTLNMNNLCFNFQ